MSIAISDLTNDPIDFKIGSKILKIQRLNLRELSGHFEGKIKKQHLDNIRDVASLFEDIKEKRDYLNQATLAIPNATKLQKLASEYLQTEEGMLDILKIGMVKLQKLTEEEIDNVLIEAKEEEIQLLIQYLLGYEAPKNEEELKKNVVL
jgi:hypothetical protein